MHARSLVVPATLAALCAALSACGSRDAGSPAAAGPTLSMTGIGPVQIGMSRQSLTAALHNFLALGAGPASDCMYRSIRIDSGSTSPIGVLVVHDSIVRIEVDSGATATEWGDRIGDPESAVAARHKADGHEVRVAPNKYTGPTGHDVTVTLPHDSSAALIFETDGAKVVRYRVGRWPEVGWVERCG